MIGTEKTEAISRYRKALIEELEKWIKK
jgi:hypothetical protein